MIRNRSRNVRDDGLKDITTYIINRLENVKTRQRAMMRREAEDIKDTQIQVLWKKNTITEMKNTMARINSYSRSLGFYILILESASQFLQSKKGKLTGILIGSVLFIGLWKLKIKRGQSRIWGQDQKKHYFFN